MPAIRLSRRAEDDLLNIGEYTRRTWGEAQSDRYIDKLELCCRRRARNPKLGRPCDDIRRGWRRLEHGRHVILYRQDRHGILISRILHQRMLPGRYPTD